MVTSRESPHIDVFDKASSTPSRTMLTFVRFFAVFMLLGGLPVVTNVYINTPTHTQAHY